MLICSDMKVGLIYVIMCILKVDMRRFNWISFLWGFFLIFRFFICICVVEYFSLFLFFNLLLKYIIYRKEKLILFFNYLIGYFIYVYMYLCIIVVIFLKMCV